MKKPPLHPLAGALLVLIGGLGLSALPLMPLALPPVPAPLDRLPASLLVGAAASLVAALGVAWRLRAARRRSAEQRAEHDTLAFEQEGLLQHLAELGEKAQRDAEFAASTEAALRDELAQQAERLALVDAALLRIEMDEQGQLLTAAAGLSAGSLLRLGAGAREAMQAGQAWCGPLALPDGEVMLLRVQPAGDGRFLGLGLPQTALWRQRAELQQALERQREWLDGAQAGGWNWQLGRERVQLDRRALALLGMTAAGSVEMDAERLTERFHPDDLPIWQGALQRLLGGRDGLLHLLLRVRRGQDWAWLQLRAAVVARDASGQAQRLAGTVIDVAAPVAADQRSHWLLRADQAVQEQLGAAGFVWQADEDLWTWNTAAPALLGVAALPTPLQLAQALQAVAEPSRDGVAALLMRVAGGGEAAEIDLSLPTGLGQGRPARLRAWVEQGQVMGLVVLNEREQAQQAQIASLTEREQAQQAQIASLNEREQAQQAQIASLTEALQGVREQLAQREAAPPPPPRPLPPPPPEPDPVLSAEQLARALAHGLHLQRGIARFQGQTGLYLRSAQAFAAIAQSLPARLQHEGQGVASQQALHSFKALATTLGFERLAQWGAAGEQRLRSGQRIDADWLRAFEEQLGEGLGLLRALVQAPAAPPLPPPDWQQTLAAGVRAADPGLLAWLAAQREPLAPWLGEDLDRLIDALSAQDYAAAQAVLASRAIS